MSCETKTVLKIKPWGRGRVSIVKKQGGEEEPQKDVLDFYISD